jgi:hypothetical protein
VLRFYTWPIMGRERTGIKEGPERTGSAILFIMGFSLPTIAILAMSGLV